VCRSILAVVAVALTASLAPAQTLSPLYPGVSGLLLNKSVHQELKTTPQQQMAILRLLKELKEKYQKDIDDLKLLSQKERLPKTLELVDRVSAETLEGLAGTLDPRQLERLRQIDLQQRGPRAFANPDVQRRLALTDEQLARFKDMGTKALAEVVEGMQGGSTEGTEAMGKLAAARKKVMGEILAALSAEQKKTWADLTGKPFALGR
jgi:formate dehydrogenase maturation protein FdhE